MRPILSTRLTPGAYGTVSSLSPTHATTTTVHYYHVDESYGMQTYVVYPQRSRYYRKSYSSRAGVYHALGTHCQPRVSP